MNFEWVQIWRHSVLAVAVGLILFVSILRALARSSGFRRDLRGTQGYLVLALVAAGAEHLMPASWVGPRPALELVAWLASAIGAVRAVAALLIHLLRRRTGVETPKILRVLFVGLGLLFVVPVILQANGISLSSVIAPVGVISLVLGLALQEPLGNFFAGLSLQLERPFSEGEVVKLGPHSGKVLELGWRSTRLLAGAGEVVTVPNNSVAKEPILNYSRHSSFMRKVSVGISYTTPPSELKDVALALLRSHPRVLDAPEPAVRLSDFTGSAINYELLFWVSKWEEGGPIEDDVRAQLWYRLRRSSIRIPLPTTEVQLSRAGRKRPLPMVEVAKLLARVDFLAPVSEELRAHLAERATTARFGRGEVIITQGDPVTSPFYVIAEGEVSVSAHGADGRSHGVARLGVHEFFGEMAVLTGEPRSATVTATRDTTLVAIERDAFAELFVHSPEAAKTLAGVLSQRREALARVLGGATPEPRPEEPTRMLEKLREIFKGIR